MATTLAVMSRVDSHHDIPLIHITGIISSPEYQRVIHAAKRVAAIHRVNLKCTPLCPFDYTVVKLKERHEHPTLVDTLFPSCHIFIDGQLHDTTSFLKTAEKRYDIPAAASHETFEAIAKAAFLNHLKTLENPIIYMDISIGAEKVGRLVVELFVSVCPSLVSRFLALCIGTESSRPLLTNTPFHRLLPGGWIESGPVERAASLPTLPDENFILKHDRRGMLSMLNAGPHSNHSSFLITMQPMAYFNGKYVAIGRLVEGEGVLARMEGTPTTGLERPEQEIKIVECGNYLDLF